MSPLINQDMREGNSGGCFQCAKVAWVKADDLKAGDHIIERGEKCFGFFYDHHSIVEETSETSVTVIQVCRLTDGSLKLERKEKAKSHLLADRCFQWCRCPSYPVRKVTYQKLGPESKSVALEIARHELEIYTRRYDEQEDRQGGEGRPEYKLFTHNCENFVSHCYNGGREYLAAGNTEPAKPGGFGISLQALNVPYVVFLCVRYPILFFLNYLSLYSYATVASLDTSFSHKILDILNIKDWKCNHGIEGMRGFQTFCDWIFFFIFNAITPFLYACLIYTYNRRKPYICKDCYNKMVYIIWPFRIVIFQLTQFGIIFLERPLYQFLVYLSFDAWFTVYVLFIFSIVEVLLFIYIPTLIALLWYKCKNYKTKKMIKQNEMK